MTDKVDCIETSLVEITKEIKEIEKDQYNDFHKFKYAGLEQIYSACRQAMIKSGVMLIPRVTEMEVREIKTKKNDPANHVIVHVEFTWVKGEMKLDPIPWVGESIDTSDKAVSKALSFAMKTFLNCFFMIPRVDVDPDGGGFELGGGNKEQKRTYKKKTTTKGAGEKKSKIVYSVLGIFGKDGLDWLNKDSEELGIFKHFLINRCGIYHTYIMKFSDDECKNVLREFCKIVGMKEIQFPLETKYLETFRNAYTKLYELEKLEISGDVGGGEEKSDYLADLRDTDGSGKVINSHLQYKAEEHE